MVEILDLVYITRRGVYGAEEAILVQDAITRLSVGFGDKGTFLLIPTK
jgi:hypothetical protein